MEEEQSIAAAIETSGKMKKHKSASKMAKPKKEKRQKKPTMPAKSAGKPVQWFAHLTSTRALVTDLISVIVVLSLACNLSFIPLKSS